MVGTATQLLGGDHIHIVQARELLGWEREPLGKLTFLTSTIHDNVNCRIVNVPFLGERCRSEAVVLLGKIVSDVDVFK
jgi:hypothetical protein